MIGHAEDAPECRVAIVRRVRAIAAYLVLSDRPELRVDPTAFLNTGQIPAKNAGFSCAPRHRHLRQGSRILCGIIQWRSMWPEEFTGPPPMSMLFWLARITMFYSPFPEPTTIGLTRDTMTEALIAFERSYARELGYSVGPHGEWISDYQAQAPRRWHVDAEP